MKSNKQIRVVETGTFGNATDFPTLVCIVDHLNNKMDNLRRIKVLRFLNKVCQTLTLINKINPTKFRAEVKRKYEIDFREYFKNNFAEYDISFRTHVDNFIHAKYNRRDEAKLQIVEDKEKQLLQQKKSAIDLIKGWGTKYNFFGSESSQDYDVIFFVDKLGTIDENARRLFNS